MITFQENLENAIHKLNEALDALTCVYCHFNEINKEYKRTLSLQYRICFERIFKDIIVSTIDLRKLDFSEIWDAIPEITDEKNHSNLCNFKKQLAETIAERKKKK